MHIGDGNDLHGNHLRDSRRGKEADYPEKPAINKPGRIAAWAYPMLLLMSVFAAIGLNNIIAFLDIAKYSEAYRKASEILYSPSFAEQILFTGILAPVAEELIFRGVIFRFLRKKFSFLPSMLVSAFIFGLYHGNLVQFVYAGILGLMLAWMYERFGTLIAPVLSHMAMNITACVLTEAGIFSWMFARTLRAAGVTLLCVAGFFFSFISIRRMIFAGKKEN